MTAVPVLATPPQGGDRDPRGNNYLINKLIANGDDEKRLVCGGHYWHQIFTVMVHDCHDPTNNRRSEL